MTTATFKDVLQCKEGKLKGLLAQVISTNNGEVEMFCRSFEGTPTLFKVTTEEMASWQHIGIAALGPRPKAFEPESAASPVTGPEDSSSSPSAAPAPSPVSPLAPLNLEELLAPLPPDARAVPMNMDWGAEEPADTDPTKEKVEIVMKKRRKVKRSRRV